MFRNFEVGRPTLSLAFGLVAAAFLLAGVWWIDDSSQKQQLANHRASVLESANASRSLLAAGLNTRLHLVRGLAAFATSRQQFSAEEFQTFARELQGKQTGIRSLQLAPNAVVTHVYPVAGNEAAVGLDLLAHTTQKEAVQRTMDSRGYVVAGPLELVQGGYGLIGRLPILPPTRLVVRSSGGLPRSLSIFLSCWPRVARSAQPARCVTRCGAKMH